MSIKITTNEFVDDNLEKFTRFVCIEALGKDELPAAYTEHTPAFWVETCENGDVFVEINGLSHATLKVGEVYPRDYFYHFLDVVKKSGFKLTHLRPREKNYEI